MRWEGEEAVQMANRLIPGINRAGARKADVQLAVQEIEEAGPSYRVPSNGLPGAEWRRGSLWTRAEGDGSWRPIKEKHMGLIHKLPHPSRLALEMALHEEQERRALQGELKGLEAAWKQAEEIAAISDSLLLPEGTEDFLEEHRS